MLEVAIRKRYNDFMLEVEFTAGVGVTGLLGSSGCGKSLTLKCIAGIVKPDSGCIVLDGRVLFDSARGVNLPPQERRTGYLFQQYALFPHMTVQDNILAALHRMPRGARGEALAQALRRFDLTALAYHYPRQLSGGQQQRAALARLVAGQPQLMLLDEPLASLDSHLRWQTEQEILEVLSGHMGGALFVSHDREEIFRLCTDIALLEAGHVDICCEKRRIFENPQTVAAARLTGCQNISRARLVGPRLLEALDWGCTLHTAEEAPEGISHVGCRAHELAEGHGENSFDCTVARVIEERLCCTVLLRRGQTLLRWELPAPPQIRADDTVRLTLPPQKILLLSSARRPSS